MLKRTLPRNILLILVTSYLTMSFALPVYASGTKPTPVVPGMDRRIPGKVESANPGTPWAKTRTYTPPVTNEPAIQAPAKLNKRPLPPATASAERTK